MIILKNIVFLVPQQGTLEIKTEFGRMTVAPNEICVIQQGIKFSVGVSELSRYYFFHVKIAMKFKKRLYNYLFRDNDIFDLSINKYLNTPLEINISSCFCREFQRIYFGGI